MVGGELEGRVAFLHSPPSFGGYERYRQVPVLPTAPAWRYIPTYLSPSRNSSLLPPDTFSSFLAPGCVFSCPFATMPRKGPYQRFSSRLYVLLGVGSGTFSVEQLLMVTKAPGSVNRLTPDWRDPNDQAKFESKANGKIYFSIKRL
jgi:hypothetical protein